MSSNERFASARNPRLALMMLLLTSKQVTHVAAWVRNAPRVTTQIRWNHRNVLDRLAATRDPFIATSTRNSFCERPAPLARILLPNSSRLFHSSSTVSDSSSSDGSLTSLSTDAPSTTSSNSNDSEITATPRKFVAYPFDYHREMDIRIDTLTNLGVGIARINLSEVLEDVFMVNTPSDNQHQDGENASPPLWVVMVPNVIPGELVKVRIFRNHKNYSEADLIEILEPSPDRVEPQCPLAGICGGCQYQHMPIELQREWKTKHVLDSFQQNQLTSVPIESALGTEHTYQYRSKITPHYQAPNGGGKSRRRRKHKRNLAAAKNGKNVTEQDDNKLDSAPVQAIGFQRSNVRQIIDVPSCPIATPPLNEEYQKARQRLLNAPYHNELGATLLFRQANLDDDYVVTDHKEHMTTIVNGISFTYLAGNFFQNNLHVLPLMVDVSMEKASQPDPTTGNTMTHFVDCYCGSGLFCLSAAAHFEVCTGIEINAKAVEEAQKNAEANGLPCTFEASRAEQIFENPNVQSFPRDTTVVMLDPPRKGCDALFLEQLEAFRPQRIVYMSCNPVTQARDAREMVSWGYDITFVQPFDLFPQTRHIECLAVLERINS